MGKRKIVYIAQSAGGVAEYLYMFLKNFKDNSFENILIVSEDYKTQIERFKQYTSKIYFIPMVRDINLKKDIISIFYLKKALNKIKPDIVYLQSSKAGAIGRIALMLNFKTKIIYNAHGWYFNAKISEKKKKFYALVEKILAKKTYKIINISKNEYDTALQYKIAPKSKMSIIENGIDFSKFKNAGNNRRETREKYKIQDNEIVLGVVGRLSEQKDPITTIKAFDEINKKFNNVRLIFVGEGELKKQIKEYAQINNLQDKMIITGWVSNVEKYIPAFDIALLPSKWEGFGLALIEYMACDKPIVATKVGGIQDIIKNEKNGYLVEVGNVSQLVNKIEILIKDKKITEKIIDENKKTRQKYDIKNVVKKHQEIFGGKK